MAWRERSWPDLKCFTASETVGWSVIVTVARGVVWAPVPQVPTPSLGLVPLRYGRDPSAGRTEATIMSQSRRRKWTPHRKLQIVLETLGSDSKLAEICRREGLLPNLVYQWCKQLLGSAEAIFARKRKGGGDPKIAKLTAETRRMKDVIAEITAENLDLKKRSRIEQLAAASRGAAARGGPGGRSDPTAERLADPKGAGGVGDLAGQLLPVATGWLLGSTVRPGVGWFGLQAAGPRTPGHSGACVEPCGSPAPGVGLEDVG